MEYEIKNIDYNKEVILFGYENKKINGENYRIELNPYEGKLLSRFIMNMPVETLDYFHERMNVLEHDYYNDDGLFIFLMDIEFIIFRMMLYFNKTNKYKKHHKLINKILKAIDTWSSDYVFISGFYLMNEES